MNLHNLIAGENVTNGELEEQVSRFIGAVLISSVLVNIVAVPLAVENIKVRIKHRKLLKK